MKSFMFASLMLALLLATGCSTVKVQQQDRIDRLTRMAGVASELAIRLDLQSNPDHRTKYEITTAILKSMSMTNNYDPVEFAFALQDLPIKELKGDNGVLIVTSVVLLWDEVMAETTPIQKPEVVSKVMNAVIGGFERGLVAIPK